MIGVLGPTSRTASLSPDVNRPGFRATSFDELAAAYREAAEGLIEGGSDVLMVETIFDTLNAKAALFAIDDVFAAHGGRLPVMISGTITDASGRTLSGTDRRGVLVFAAARAAAVDRLELRTRRKGPARAHRHPVAGRRYEYQRHPNAGLPNAFGGYDETPEDMAAMLREFAEAGLLNLVGGCCGTTPGHIAAIAQAVRGVPPRRIPRMAEAA